MFDSVFTNKIVAFIITPIVTAFAAWLVPFIERNLPGNPDLDDTAIAALAVAGAVAGFGISLKFLSGLDNWQKLKQFGALNVAVAEGVDEEALDDDLNDDDFLDLEAGDLGTDTTIPPDEGDAGAPTK